MPSLPDAEHLTDTYLPEGWIPTQPQLRCSSHHIFGAVPVARRLDQPLSIPFGFHSGMSDSQLRALADSGEDGLAQYVYGDRILAIASSPSQQDIDPERVLQRVQTLDSELFVSAQRYFVDAVRNHNWIATTRLALMYFPFDKVEARAWMLIANRAGRVPFDMQDYESVAPALAEGFEYRRIVLETLDALTEAEKAKSESRAEELLSELDLASGLLPPNECRSGL